MEIKTKYNIGDRVFLIGPFKCVEDVICRIVVDATDEGVEVRYQLRGGGTGSGYREEDLFVDKKDIGVKIIADLEERILSVKEEFGL